MKIRKNTSHTLIVDDTPWLIAIMLVFMTVLFTGIGLMTLAETWAGLVFVGFGLIMGPLFLFIFARRVQVVLHRPGHGAAPWVEMRRANLLRRSKMRHDLDTLARAEVDSTQGDKGTLYRLVLVFRNGPQEERVPVTQAYSNIGNPHDAAEAINRWLSAGQAAGTA